jgi:hypothetical protein
VIAIAAIAAAPGVSWVRAIQIVGPSPPGKTAPAGEEHGVPGIGPSRNFGFGHYHGMGAWKIAAMRV